MLSEIKRKNPRLPEFDYSSAGAYFLTVCAKEHRSIFSQVIGGGVLDAPRCKLTNYGALAEEMLLRVAEHQKDGLSLDSYVFMPNHVHLIIHIADSVDLSHGASRTPPPYGICAKSECQCTHSLVHRHLEAFY